MQVSLRKANALQVAINEALKNLEFKADIAINEFQNPAKEIESASARFTKNLLRRNNLLDALYEVRKATAFANDANNIGNRLADLARLEKDAAFFATYAKANVQTDLKVIQGKLEKIANRTEDSYYAKAEVETSIFTETEIESFRSTVSAVKKQKQKLQDELLELNVRTTVELSEATVATLTAEDIL